LQEVAVVIAEDRYAAADGVEAVLAEYEELPVVIDPYEALKPDAPVIREDLAGKTSGAHGPRVGQKPGAEDGLLVTVAVTAKADASGLVLAPLPFAAACGLAVAKLSAPLARELATLPDDTLWLVGHRALRVVPRVASM
jgi:hypothetical protein